MVRFDISRSNTYCLLWTIFIVSVTEECCGTTTALETDSSGCLSFSFKTGTFATIVRNGITLCYIYDERGTIIPAAWNRSFTCTYSNGTFNLCVSDLRFSDSGLFSLKVSGILEQNVTLEIQGKRYNLTGSSDFAVLGNAFNWTCVMYIPPGNNITAVFFRRNGYTVVAIGYINSTCTIQSSATRYKYRCSSESTYVVTIPAQNMTEYEQGSVWRCEYIVEGHNYRSPDMVLNVAIDVNNVSMIPTDYPLTIREGTKREVRCVVNRNAVPAPNINWYLDSSEITSRAGTDTTAILTGNRADNTKTLQCTATNNNKFPKTASTILNIEYPPYVNVLSQQNIIEGRNLLVTCSTTYGNPRTTNIFWTKDESPEFKVNGTILQIPFIQRNKSGIYRCTAENTYSNGEMGTHSQSMIINVLYSPIVNKLSQQDIIEGRNLEVTCQATPGNPSSTTFYWTKLDNYGFRQNGSTLQLYNTQRTSSGTYRCTAENNYSNGERGTDRQSMVINVLYPPIVNKLYQHDIIEGSDLSVNCTATPGNPSSTTFYWTKVDDQGFRQNGSTLQLLNVLRNSSGVYMCSAENIYTNGGNGIQNQTMVVNVMYHPTIENKPYQIINTSQTVTLTRHISSNPPSDVSWYDKTKLLKTQISVLTTTFTLKDATCTDTKNYTLVVSNGIGNTVTALVELIVNCVPMPIPRKLSLGITFASVIDFSTTVIAYPEPHYELMFKNGSRNNQWKSNLIRNTLNNFTIHFSQTVFELISFEVYHLLVINALGEATILVNVFRQRKPDNPRDVEVMCEFLQARVQWISSFDGGDPQNFTVIILNSLDGKSVSYGFHDEGENKTHVAFVSNLQPSVTYWFYVTAKNSHGSSISEITSCKTVEETTSSQTGVVAGSVGGALVFVTIVLILGIIAHRRYTCIIAFEKRNRDKEVDTKNDASNNTTIKEQQDHRQRDMYDDLTPNENANQYEAILQKDNHGNNEKLYEQLQESVAKEGHSDNRNIPLKTKDSSDDEFVPLDAEEYANTSFMK